MNELRCGYCGLDHPIVGTLDGVDVAVCPDLPEGWTATATSRTPPKEPTPDERTTRL